MTYQVLTTKEKVWNLVLEGSSLNIWPFQHPDSNPFFFWWWEPKMSLNFHQQIKFGIGT
jgi:hypothetical protein